MRRNDAIRTAVVALGTVFLTGIAGVAAAQGQYAGRPSPGLGIGVRFGLGLVVNLVVGALALAVARQKTDEIVSDARTRPIAAILTGLGFAVVVGVVVFVLAITGVGLLLAIPILLALIPLGIVGSAITCLTVGKVLVDGVGVDSYWAALGIGAVIVAVVNAIPVVGLLFSLTVGSVGTGVIVLRYWKGAPRNRTGQSPVGSSEF